MMADYNDYLATSVLNESQTVSYRMLSRALKIHTQRAKQALFDFHNRQNKKKPGSVSATYLILGRKQQADHTHLNGGHSQADEDVAMQSSPPFPSSSAPRPSQDESQAGPIWTRHVILAREADLQAAKASIDEITAIHIYSLSASPLTDLQTLTECSRRVRVDNASEDPLGGAWAKYGVIQNDRVWRRTRNGKPMPLPAPTAAPAPATAKSVATAKAAQPSVKSEPTAAASTTKKETAPTSTARPPALKKETSSIMSSFAKSKAPSKAAPPKPKQEPEDSGPALSDEDADPDDEFGDGMELDDVANGADDAAATTGKGKKEREEELRRMMDEDGDVDPDVEAADAKDEAMGDGDVPTPTAGSGDVDGDVDMAGAKTGGGDDGAGEVKVGDGRRRGRRRVMKKKTVKDEEGYLVTKEEAAWESFSEEDEPAAKKSKPSVMSQFAKGGANSAAAKTAGAAGGAKGSKGAKGGSIMSFFAKK